MPETSGDTRCVMDQPETVPPVWIDLPSADRESLGDIEATPSAGRILSSSSGARPARCRAPEAPGTLSASGFARQFGMRATTRTPPSAATTKPTPAQPNHSKAVVRSSVMLGIIGAFSLPLGRPLCVSVGRCPPARTGETRAEGGRSSPGESVRSACLLWAWQDAEQRACLPPKDGRLNAARGFSSLPTSPV